MNNAYIRVLTVALTVAAGAAAVAAEPLGLAVGPRAGDLPEYGPEKGVTADDRSDLAVTVYPDGRALVRDRRTVALDDGHNLLAFEDVSPSLDTGSVLFWSAEAIAVIEQRPLLQRLTPDALFRHSVGRNVGLVRSNPVTGTETVVGARLLSADGGGVFVIGDHLETGRPDRMVFYSLPPELRARPAVVTSVDNGEGAGLRTLEVSYLTGGVGWRADYAGQIDSDAGTLTLSAWATVTNTSGISLPEAQLALVAGIVSRADRRMEAAVGKLAQTRAAPPPPAPTSVGDVYVYAMPRRVTLEDGQVRQVALLGPLTIAVKHHYLVRGAPDLLRRQGESRRPRGAETRISFVNQSDSGAGVPLPAGTVRLYRRDGDALTLVGEDRVGDTAVGDTVRLSLGRAFDVTASRRQTDFKRIGEQRRRTYESAYRIDLNNAKAETVMVEVRETLRGDWEIFEQSHVHEKQSSTVAAWSIPVPAGETATLTYRVRVRQ